MPQARHPMFAGLLLCALLGPTWAAAGELLVDVLDVGQGDAILLRTGGKTVLVDAGTSGANVTRLLQDRGVHTIDLLVATHAHADHIGGMEAVVRKLRVLRYLDSGQAHTTQTWTRLSATLSEHGTSVLGSTPGQVIKLSDEVQITVLAPPSQPFRKTRSDLNANSVVLLVDHLDVELLLPGDAEAPTEEWLVQQGLPDIEVLKVSHHGSAHSTVPALLTATRPELALISVGANNRYGHPDEATLRRLTESGAQVVRTDLAGTITLRSDGHGLLLRTERGAPVEIVASQP